MPLLEESEEGFDLVIRGLKTAIIKRGSPLPGNVAAIRCGSRITHATIVKKESGRLSRVLRLDNYRRFFPNAKSYEEAIRSISNSPGHVFTGYHLWFPEPNFIKKLAAVRNKLNSINVSWAVCGSAASYCYGSLCKIEVLEIVIKDAEERESAEYALSKIEGLHLFDLLRVDVGAKGYLFFMDNSMESNIRRCELRGVELPVIPVEDNIILKSLCWRGTGNAFDLFEVKDMVTNNHINLPYIRRKVQTFHVENPVASLLKTLGLKIEVEKFGILTTE